MKNSIYFATTYLKLLRSYLELTQILDTALDVKLNAALEQEYLYGSAIITIFQVFADQGLNSWVLRFEQHLSVENHGPLRFAALSAPDLKTAIEVLAEFNIIRTSAYRCNSVCKGGESTLLQKTKLNTH